MRKSRQYLPQQSVFPTMGLNSFNPPSQLDPSFSPKLLNVDVRRGEIRKRKGYATLGDEVDGTVMAVITFEVSEGVVKTVLVTTTKQYVLNGTSWDNITLQETAVDVDWTGDTNDLVDWVVGTDNSGTWLFITNGKDAPRKWDGSGLFVPHGFDIVGFTTCKCFAVFKGSLLVGNVNTTEPKTIVISDTEDFTSFNAGNADVQALPDAEGEIVRMIPLADQVAIYATNSIHAVTFTGGTTVYSVIKVVNQTRLLSPRAIINLGPIHVYMSQENIYLYDGTRQFRPTADVVQKNYRSDVFLDSARRTFAFYDGIETTGWMCVPTLSGGMVVYTMEVDMTNIYYPQNIRWSRFQLGNTPNAMGYLLRDNTPLWNSPAFNVPWNQISFLWNDNSLKKGFPQVVFGSESQVYLFDGSTISDDTTPINAYIDSPDFTVPGEYVSERGRWIEVEMELKGSNAVIQYSLDQGGTWNSFGGSTGTYNTSTGVATLTNQWTNYRFFCDGVSKYFRIRISDNTLTGWWERRFYKVWVSPAGGW